MGTESRRGQNGGSYHSLTDICDILGNTNKTSETGSKSFVTQLDVFFYNLENKMAKVQKKRIPERAGVND